MPSRSPIPPTFEPGSGWYRPSAAAPGSMVDRQEKRRAAYRCVVLVLRRRGERIPATELMAKGEMVAGLLVCESRYSDRWYASLYRDETMDREALPKLLQVQLVRENDGVRLYQGIQVDHGVEYRQTWAAAVDDERARRLVQDMVYREANP